MDKQLNELVAESSNEFKKFTRMSSVDFEYLLNKVSTQISKKNTQLREAIPARIRLVVTLRYLATGDDFESLHFLFKISPQLISQIIPEVCQALNQVLKEEIKVSVNTHIQLLAYVKINLQFTIYELLLKNKSVLTSNFNNIN